MAFEMDKDNEYINEEDVKIVVFGVGGGGGNTIATMVEKNICGVHYAIANTNTKDLDNKDKSKITTIHLSKKEEEIAPSRVNDRVAKRRKKVVRGAGGNPKFGEECAKDTLNEIINEIEDADMIFIAAGMGGGTGTGAAPVIAKAAKEMGILTVAVTTSPFAYEGLAKIKLAHEGIRKMRECVDALILIDDQKVFMLPNNEDLSMDNTFKAVDEVLCKAVIGIIEIIDAEGFINVDFADVCAALEDAGLAHMAIGHGKGEHAREKAVDEVLNSPLLETSINGAKRGLINISVPSNFPITEYQRLASEISSRFNPEAFYKVGVVFDRNLDDDELEIVAVATDFNEDVLDTILGKILKNAEEEMKKMQEQNGAFGANPDNSFAVPFSNGVGNAVGVPASGFKILNDNPDDPYRANNLMNAMNAINNGKNK